MRGKLLVLLVLGGSAACGSVPAAPDANAELCFDGMDNDGNGLADCADPGCDPTARCVPSSATQTAGVTVGEDEPCPAGFTGGETIIHRGLQPSACTGCGCTPGDTTCVAELWTYDDPNVCGSDTTLSGGIPVGFTISTTTCSDMDTPPHYLANLFLDGVRANIVPTSTCNPNGSGIPGTSTWTDTVKFCSASPVAIGCDASETCAPRAASADTQCAIIDGGGTCEGYTTTDADWYGDYDDQRTCGACFCEAVGGDCANVLVEIGNDYTCFNYRTIGDDSKLCYQGYHPPARLIGAPTPPTGCSAEAPVSGNIAPTGQATLCCTPI